MKSNTLYALLASLSLLVACQTGNQDSNAGNVGDLSYQQTTFQRMDGEHCPGQPGTTEENAHCATLNIAFPTISSPSHAELAKTFNQFIQGQLLDYSDENDKQPASLDELATMFFKDFRANPPDMNSAWEMERSITTVYSNARVVTLLFSENGYTGGAHPFSGQRYFVLNTQTGEALTLKDLVGSSAQDTLTKAAEQAFRQARELAPNASLTDAGFWFEGDKFKLNDNVGVLPDGLHFIFNPYEVAPYAMGQTEFTVPYSALRDVLPADSPLTTVN